MRERPAAARPESMETNRTGESRAALAADLELFDRLNPVIHTRGRLAIMSALAAHGPLTFTVLRDALGLTDGNLAAHLGALEDAGYVVAAKVSRPGKPLTEISLTEAGQTAFDRYVEALALIVHRHRPQAVAPAAPAATVPTESGAPGSLDTELL